MESTKDDIPLSFKTIHRELAACAAVIVGLFNENLPEKFGFKKENFDSVYGFYEIWFFLLSGVDMRCHSFLKNNDIRERLFIYLIDEMFSDLGIETAKEKNEIVEAMNIRLEEYGNALNKSKTAQELNKEITLIFIQKLTHAIMKREFLNQTSIGLFPLQEGIITSGYTVAIFYIKAFDIFLDTIFATNDQFCFLDEGKINTIRTESLEKRKELLAKF